MDIVTIAAPRENRRIAHGEAIPRWSKGSRLALGLWTSSMPLVAAAMVAWAIVATPYVPPALFAAPMGLMVIHVILLLFYLAFAAQNPRLGRARTPWMLALVFAGPVAIPAYWFVHVWYAPRLGRSGVDDEVPGLDEADERNDALGR